MSSSINLFHLAIAYEKLSSRLFDSYCEKIDVHIKDSEKKDIYEFVNKVKTHYVGRLDDAMPVLDNFITSYVVSGIKEIDLLSKGDSYLVCIELKSESNVAAIEEQLKKDYYYLHETGLELFIYSIDRKNDNIYKFLEKDQKAVLSSIDELCVDLESHPGFQFYREDLDKLMCPSMFLVSPFNNTERFLKQEYFLSTNQVEIKKNIGERFSSGESFVAITGEAGTGKTLLVYDIAYSDIQKGKKVLIIHAGKLNEGQNLLNKKGWNITNPKHAYELNINSYDLIIFDEAQRINPNQFGACLSEIVKYKKACVISFDEKQCLRKTEFENDNATRIKGLVNNTVFKLSKKIRTNEKVADFVMALFRNKCQVKGPTDNVEIVYCDNLKEMIPILTHAQKQGYVVPKFTPEQHRTAHYETWLSSLPDTPSAHDIIGQEFEKVAGIIGPGIGYKEGVLTSDNDKDYYHEIGMMYQIFTRAKSAILVVVYSNATMFERCLKLIKGENK